MSLISLTEGRQIYIVCGHTDLRRGIDGLARTVKVEYGLDPCSQDLFLFAGRKADCFKGLYFDDERGFVLIYVWLEDGHFQWPRTPEEACRIDQKQYKRLLQGLQIMDRSTIGQVDAEALRASL